MDRLSFVNAFVRGVKALPDLCAALDTAPCETAYGAAQSAPFDREADVFRINAAES